MKKDKKSDDHYVKLPTGISKRQMMAVIEKAAERAGLYISHIGGYSRTSIQTRCTGISNAILKKPDC